MPLFWTQRDHIFKAPFNIVIRLVCRSEKKI